MADPVKLPSGRWRVEVRTGRGRGAPRQSKTFATKTEARRWATDLAAQVQRGSWVEVDGGDVTFAEWARHWLLGLRLAPASIDAYRGSLARVLPELGDYRIDQLRRPALERVLTGLPHAPATRAGSHFVLTASLRSAVEDGRIAANPMDGIKPPSIPKREVQVLGREEIGRLLNSCAPHHRAVLLTAAGTGLRQGELLGVRRSRVDFLRRTLSVEEQVTSGVGRPPALSPLKTPASRRRLPVPDAVLEVLSELARPDADALFLTAKGGLWRREHFNVSVWKPALKAAELDPSLGMHVLRHSYASHMIAAGLHPRVIMARMGHSSIVETMDRYGHLFPDAEDATRAALDDLFARDAQGTRVDRPHSL